MRAWRLPALGLVALILLSILGFLYYQPKCLIWGGKIRFFLICVSWHEICMNLFQRELWRQICNRIFQVLQSHSQTVRVKKHPEQGLIDGCLPQFLI